MSANQSDPVLERLNYFNGQRLTANDLRTEQGHHVGMRRVLNRSLYSAGIVVGLEVEKAPEDKKDPTWKHKVIVRRGLAFDHLGREIFVPEDVLVLVGPDEELAKRRIPGKHTLQLLVREGMELLDAHDGNRVGLALSPRVQQRVVDLAAAQQHAGHLRGLDRRTRLRRPGACGIVEHGLERPVREIGQHRHGRLVP